MKDEIIGRRLTNISCVCRAEREVPQISADLRHRVLVTGFKYATLDDHVKRKI